ncbi:MAG: SGNH/GDSL hydrolase family protein [Crocinitomicaceae bacterium]|jgi:lysophospholipase L1-like esterase|nr:SGNH/GDSL hydrolase family protein [Crocinitomicaceae bacterium]
MIHTFIILLSLLQFSTHTNSLGSDEKTFLALGDSYTIGESVAPKDAWPNKLVEKLNVGGLHFDSPEIIARTGWRADELYDEAKKKTKKKEYDYVSVMVGVNNQFQGRSIDDFELKLNDLITFALNHVNRESKRVFVVSIPDYGVTPFARKRRMNVSREIDEWNKVIKRVAEKYGVSYIDVTEISRMAKENKGLIAKDGLHPSERMHELWADEIYKHFSFD